MPLHINTPGWKVRRTGTVRGAARTTDQDLPSLPSEFLTDDSRVIEEVVVEPAARGRTRDAAPAAPVLDLTCDVQPGRTAVLALRHPSGALTFHLPVQAVARSTRGSSVVRFQVTVRTPATRGLIGSAVKAAVISIAKLAGDQAVSLLLPRLAAAVEKAVWKQRGLVEGWLKVTKETLLAAALAPGKPVSPERSLLLLHGTFSNTAAAFRHLASSDFFDRVKDTYGDRMFAFDHFSVSRTPQENAQMLLDLLPETATTFDVITHSRGGLVLRQVVERGRHFGDRAHRFTLNRAVLVASPNEGTPLATPQRWGDTVGWIANVLEMFPDNPFTTGASFVANGLVWLANHASGDLPGLHAMDATGEPIEEIQAPPGPPADAYSALVANYHPPGHLVQRLADAGIDQFFGSANDLVVPSEGGWRIDRTSTPLIPSTRIGCFGPGGNVRGDAVTHVSFFKQEATTDFLVKALLGQPQGLAGIDPRKSLPDRRLRRGMSDAPAPPATQPSGTPTRERYTPQPDLPLQITIVNGDLTFEREALLVGHYNSLRLTGTEQVMNRLVGGMMERSLAKGVYPVAIGTQQVFLNSQPDLERGSFLPRPKAVIVAGLGDEGRLRAPALVRTVRQAVIAWAQRIAEDQKRPPTTFVLAATLVGSGGAGVTPGDAARFVAQGVYEANAMLRADDRGRRRLPIVEHLRLIELYLERATEAWRALKMQADATRERYQIHDSVIPGTGPMLRPAYSGYRGAEFDFISAQTRRDKDGSQIISYTLDTRRARSEVRAQRAQSALLDDLVATASNDTTGDEQIRQTLFNLLIPVELEPYLAGSGEMQIELDETTARIPWELLDTAHPFDNAPRTANGADDGRADEPWAIRVQLLRKLRIETFRERVSDATPDASALVIGEPACPADSYPRLYGARREAMAVRDCLRGALEEGTVRDLISDDDALPGADARTVVNALFERPWRLVHISGHGIPGTGTTPGGVVLSNGTFLGPAEIGSMRTVPELVFINCCHLGHLGEQAPYDRVRFASSVAGALIAIGVRCVVAAGWAVDDEAARVFAETFYGALLGHERLVTAVSRARAAARDASPHSNTWAAYQCYGDPDWVFLGTRSEATFTPDFSDIASAASVTLALDRLTVQTKFQGANREAQLTSLRALEARTKEQGWAGEGDVAEMFGEAFVEAGDLHTGMAWYAVAVSAEDGKASLRAAEQLANVQSRVAWTNVDRAARQRDDVAIRTRARTTTRVAAARARKEAEGLLSQEVARALDLIDQSLTLLTKLVAVAPTMERLSLLGSACKRRALVLGIHRASDMPQALRQMKTYYDKAWDVAKAGDLGDLYYPASNSLAADLALNAGRTVRELDRTKVDAIRESLKRKSSTDPDFWSVVGITELDQYEAIAKKRLASAAGKLLKAYEDLHRRVGATHMWTSVYDNAYLVLTGYSARATAREAQAAEKLLALLRTYAYPAQS
jgi:hypothetical protein